MNNGIHPRQLRAARALVGWSREDLAHASSINVRSVARIEDGDSVPRTSTMDAFRKALEDAGVIFIDEDEVQGPGVRLRKSR